MENPIKMDDLGVPWLYYFWKHPCAMWSLLVGPGRKYVRRTLDTFSSKLRPPHHIIHHHHHHYQQQQQQQQQQQTTKNKEQRTKNKEQRTKNKKCQRFYWQIQAAKIGVKARLSPNPWGFKNRWRQTDLRDMALACSTYMQPFCYVFLVGSLFISKVS